MLPSLSSVSPTKLEPPAFFHSKNKLFFNQNGTRRSGYEWSLQQNTQEWLVARRGPYLVPENPEEIRSNCYTFATWDDIEKYTEQGRIIYKIGASEVGIAMGIGTYAGLPHEHWDSILNIEPYLTREQKDEKNDNKYLKWGHHAEDATVLLYERMTGYRVTDGHHWTFANTDDPLDALRFGASPDGQVWLDGVRQGLLECKNPYWVLPSDSDEAAKNKNAWEKKYGSSNRGIKVEYMAQMASTGAAWCDFMVTLFPYKEYDRDLRQDFDAVIRGNPNSPGKCGVFLKRVYYSSEYLAWMWPKLHYFSECLRWRRKPTIFHCKDPPPAVHIVDFPQFLNMQTYQWQRAEDEHAKRRGIQFLARDTFNTLHNHYSSHQHARVMGLLQDNYADMFD